MTTVLFTGGGGAGSEALWRTSIWGLWVLDGCVVLAFLLWGRESIEKLNRLGHGLPDPITWLVHTMVTVMAGAIVGLCAFLIAAGFWIGALHGATIAASAYCIREQRQRNPSVLDVLGPIAAAVSLAVWLKGNGGW